MRFMEGCVPFRKIFMQINTWQVCFIVLFVYPRIKLYIRMPVTFSTESSATGVRKFKRSFFNLE